MDSYAACAFCDATTGRAATDLRGWVLDSTARLACPRCAPGRDLMPGLYTARRLPEPDTTSRA